MRRRACAIIFVNVGSIVWRWRCDLSDLGDRTDESNEFGATNARTEEFVGLWTAHQQRVSVYLASLLGRQESVDDLLQETSLVCWREFEKFRLGTNFGAWACTVAFNRVRAWRKKKSREQLVFSDEFVASISDELIRQEEEVPERISYLNECIRGLSDHHRDLIRQRYSAGQSIDTIAERLSRSHDAVYRMLSRIRASLQECVQNKTRVAQS